MATPLKDQDISSTALTTKPRAGWFDDVPSPHAPLKAMQQSKERELQDWDSTALADDGDWVW